MTALRIRKTFFTLLLLIVSPATFSDTEPKELCFNFYIISKSTKNVSELNVYEKQREIILEQLDRTKKVFEKSRAQNCTAITFSKGKIKRIDWQTAMELSQPLDFNGSISLKDYYVSRAKESLLSLKKITGNIKRSQTDIQEAGAELYRK